jgi:hypothetical protein
MAKAETKTVPSMVKFLRNRVLQSAVSHVRSQGIVRREACLYTKDESCEAVSDVRAGPWEDQLTYAGHFERATGARGAEGRMFALELL